MILYIEDGAYPELVHYLRNPKRRAKFLYQMERKLDVRLHGEKSTKPSVKPNEAAPSPPTSKPPAPDYTPILEALRASGNKDLDGIRSLMRELGDAVRGVDSRLHEIESRPFVEKVPGEKKAPVENEIDYSDTTGIDFSKAIAVFDD